MLTWIGIAFAVVLVLTSTASLVWWQHQLQRQRYYRQLAEERKQLPQNDIVELQNPTQPDHVASEFRSVPMVRVADFVSPATLQRLRDDAVVHLDKGIRSYIPLHKKGRSLPYEEVHKLAPACLAFYHSETIRRWVSGVVGEDVSPAGDHDQSALSILFYDQPGDRIGWHFDHNFYEGRQFTVLLSLVNQTANGDGLSAGTLQRKTKDGQVVSIATEENVLVVFEGARVLHRVTPTKAGDLRVMLSMTYNTVPKISWWREIMRRFKDIAFHGFKALWD